MDLLASLNIDELPEQQTRVKDLVEKHPDFDLRLGFDACCTCGNKIVTEVLCPNCRRVSYCSESCRTQDATPLPYSESEDSEQALGHAAVICSLLKLCQHDENVECNDMVDEMSSKERQDALDRLQSERESYPATLVNVLAEGPAYQQVWSRLEQQAAERKAQIHVIGASHEAELWNASTDEQVDRVVQAYTEAFGELFETKKLQAVHLLFVGPECADSSASSEKKPWKLQRPVRQPNDKSSVIGDLVFQSRPTIYDEKVIQDEGAPDFVVFFNPGFTVPEYEWRDTLRAIPKGTPFLLATNTEVEGIADAQFLLDQDRVQSIPPGLQDIFGLYSEQDDGGTNPGEDCLSFFSVNPFCGNRVRQSGTMGNDLFVRNRWMLGGILDSYDPSKEREGQGSKKARMTTEESNRKATNPALI